MGEGDLILYDSLIHASIQQEDLIVPAKVDPGIFHGPVAITNGVFDHPDPGRGHDGGAVILQVLGPVPAQNNFDTVMAIGQ